jgi:hypothetical protein
MGELEIIEMSGLQGELIMHAWVDDVISLEACIKAALNNTRPNGHFRVLLDGREITQDEYAQWLFRDSAMPVSF